MDNDIKKLESSCEKSKEILPKIICHDGFSGGCNELAEDVNFNSSEPFKFIDEKEKIAYGGAYYFAFSYNNSGNCEITKRLRK